MAPWLAFSLACIHESLSEANIRRRGTLQPILPAKRFGGHKHCTTAPSIDIDTPYDEFNTNTSSFGVINGHLMDLRPRTDFTSPVEQEFEEMLEEAVSNLTTSSDSHNPRVNVFGNSIEEEEEEDDTPPLMASDRTATSTTANPDPQDSIDGTVPSPDYTPKLGVTADDMDLDPKFLDTSMIREEAKRSGQVNPFLIALGIFVTSLDISTSQYSAMVDLFNYVMLEPSVVKQFPRSLSTLKKYMRSVLPLQTIKAYSFRPDTDQLSPQMQTPANAYYFDIKEIASIWLSDT
ncbi:hypothetical protein L211DRAFT_852781 [Terfezia boudieri ATCC MYA-4762]|uniref:Uncharacterized protein n=1 Tax=Terfezia boudieri ATCC MYA-4762 TaxID=1051890 RepID=A0A3N4LPK3_9PEZI|nr:hypothetical protein L211DRAFT_852781 [Terfezia boudieri ATCC MYA-4762]